MNKNVLNKVENIVTGELMSNFFSRHKAFKSRLLQTVHKASVYGKGFITVTTVFSYYHDPGVGGAAAWSFG